MSWTEERVTLLKKLWGEGKTASEIAKIIGDVTRNAVIGKAHRLKLSGRSSPIQNAAKKTANKIQKEASNTNMEPAKRGRPKRMPVEPSASIPVKRVKLADLKDRQCRWPLGDPRDDDFSFCGCGSMPGIPYCSDHAQVAYQMATRKKLMALETIDDTPKKAKEEEELFDKLRSAG